MSRVGEERLDFDYNRYKERLQGDGIADIFARKFTNAMRELVSLGFSSESEVVNYYKNLAREVISQLHSRFQVMARQNTRLRQLGVQPVGAEDVETSGGSLGAPGNGLSLRAARGGSGTSLGLGS